MKLDILSGVFTGTAANYRTAYPINMVPVPKQTGLNEGYLRTAEGIALFATFGAGEDGTDRGGINWNGVCYRVTGTNFIRVNSNGTVDVLAQLPPGGQVSFDYSFDRLIIAAAKKLYYWSGSTLTQVTDPDLGVCLDAVFLEGYTLTTDGTSIVQTDLTDPTSVNPLHYGSSEADPDPVVALKRLRNELLAINRYTIETFTNVAGNGFAFARVDGAMIPKGAIGTHACCEYLGAIAFIGSARNEQPSVYIGSDGAAAKVATREIEQRLSVYTEAQLSQCVVEARSHNLHQHLYLHLPNETLVYDAAATAALGQPVWFSLTSKKAGKDAPYRAINYVWCYNQWICGDRQRLDLIGILTDTSGSQYGDSVSWQFDVGFLYNGGMGGIINALELVGLPGRSPNSAIPIEQTIWMSYTKDGLLYSQEHAKSLGKPGNYDKRPQWRRCGFWRNFLGLRFRGATNVPLAFARLEANIEALG